MYACAEAAPFSTAHTCACLAIITWARLPIDDHHLYIKCAAKAVHLAYLASASKTRNDLFAIKLDHMTKVGPPDSSR